MLILNGSVFYELITGFKELADSLNHTADQRLSPEAKGTLLQFLQQFEKVLPDQLELNAAAIAVMEFIRRLKRSDPIQCSTCATSIFDIQNTLRRELGTKRMFFLEAGKNQYFEPRKPLFGDEVEAKFPQTLFEIDEAAKCISLNRDTAAVFHLMRVMEVGIKTIAKSLSIPDPIKSGGRNWGTILQNIKSAIDARKAPATPWKTPTDKEFFESSYALLDAVKNAWRNTTMHVENKYTSEETEHIFNVVRGFMKKLASRMNESGEPLA